jgi:hypothetical protein
MAGGRVGTRSFTRENLKRPAAALLAFEHGRAPEPARVVVNRGQTP